MTLEPLSPWVPMLMNTEYVTSGASSPFSVYRKHCSLSRLADSKKKQIELPSGEELSEKDFEVLAECPECPPAYLRLSGVTRFFKLVVVFADAQDAATHNSFEWISRKFSSVSFDEVKKSENTRFCKWNGDKTVVCIKSICLESLLKSNSATLLSGISAMVLVASSRLPSAQIFYPLLDRLISLVRSCSNLLPFPITAMLLKSKGEFNTQPCFSSFLNGVASAKKAFSAVNVVSLFEIENQGKNASLISSVIKWSVWNQALFPALTSCFLRNFLEDTFTAIFNTVFWKLSLQEYKLLCLIPYQIIDFYNTMLEKRADPLCSVSLGKVLKFWPPHEFSTVNPDFRFIDTIFQKQIKDFVLQLSLPHFKGNPLSEKDLFNYVQQIAVTTDSESEMLFISISNILQQHGPIYWPDVISKCAYYRLCKYSSKLKDCLNNEVFYMQEEMNAIEFDEFWENVLSELNKLLASQDMEEAADAAVKKSLIEVIDLSDDDLDGDSSDKDDIKGKGNATLSVTEKLSTSLKDKLSSLQSALDKQNIESEEFMSKLNDTIFGETIDIADSECDMEVSDSPFAQSLCSGTSEKDKETSSSQFWEKYLNVNSSACSFTSLSEKLRDLQYNIQKNNEIEDNLSMLLEL